MSILHAPISVPGRKIDKRGKRSRIQLKWCKDHVQVDLSEQISREVSVQLKLKFRSVF